MRATTAMNISNLHSGLYRRREVQSGTRHARGWDRQGARSKMLPSGTLMDARVCSVAVRKTLSSRENIWKTIITVSLYKINIRNPKSACSLASSQAGSYYACAAFFLRNTPKQVEQPLHQHHKALESRYTQGEQWDVVHRQLNMS